ncbi:hypothetical protein Tco_0875630, partial [Tanacetum coccineum]
YGYIKNHKKTVKNGQARTRESEEYKKKPRIQSRSQKSQTRIISMVSLSSFTLKSHVINGRSTKRCGFCTKFTHTTSTSEPQTNCQLGNPCELTSDPTAIKLDQMIAIIGWQRLKEVERDSRG